VTSADRLLLGPIAAICLVAACGPASSPTPPANTTPRADKPEIAEPTPALMLQIASGELPLESLIDRQRGLRVAEYYSDPSGTEGDAEGMVKRAERACGAELDETIKRTEVALAQRREIGELTFSCEGWSCRREAPGEFELETRFRFDGSGAKLVLVELILIEGGPVTEEFVREAEAWTEAELDKLEPGCS
jgi:hypothetical protein